ncbi:MAG: hypothetical protein ACI36X_08295 [Bacteroidaceae bacterium]
MPSPTKMGYARAKAHLMRVAAHFRSQGIGRTLERIRTVEEESRQ